MATKNIKHYVNESWLTSQVSCLNKWLDQNLTDCKQRNLTIIKRNYYVRKIIELEASNLNFVQIWS